MVLTRTAAAGLLLLWANCASAYTGADQLVRDCTVTPKKSEEAFRQVRCTGYVGGVLDTYGVVSGLYRNVSTSNCAPGEGITVRLR